MQVSFARVKSSFAGFTMFVAEGWRTCSGARGNLSHRTLHMSSFLWRFHRIHHRDDFVDVTTTYRTHPVETVWRFLFSVVPVWLIGIPAQAVLIQRLLQSAFGIIDHSNVRLPRAIDRVLSVVLVFGAALHAVRHGRDGVRT
jgi:sterol desaturase/sphingolipid hydroxylase (fatty acid hydroxylase superfamily)